MFALLLAAAAADPFSATQLRDAGPAAVAGAARRAGVEVDAGGVAGGFAPGGSVALWDWLDLAAGATGRRVVLSPDGRRVRLAAGPPAPADVVGAFRLAVRGVTCRHEYDAGPPVCEVGLDLHWEPRLAVVRVADAAGGKAAVTNARYATGVRLPAVPRSQSKLPTLDVSFTVTAAERMLSFTVPDLQTPKPQTEAGVSLTSRPARPLGEVVELRLDLTYPEGHPEFESFESWTAGNRCRLVYRDGRTLTTDDFEVTEGGRKAAAAYRFRAAEVGDLAGWSLVYDTPGPLREFPVRFALKDIPLP
jgi:hypothetical protein